MFVFPIIRILGETIFLNLLADFFIFIYFCLRTQEFMTNFHEACCCFVVCLIKWWYKVCWWQFHSVMRLNLVQGNTFHLLYGSVPTRTFFDWIVPERAMSSQNAMLKRSCRVFDGKVSRFPLSVSGQRLSWKQTGSCDPSRP